MINKAKSNLDSLYEVRLARGLLKKIEDKINAYDLKIAALSDRKWIEAKYKAPNRDTYYLTTVKDKHKEVRLVTINLYQDGTWHFVDPEYEVLAYMELPVEYMG